MSASYCFGQESRATVVGRVTDSSGAVVPGVRVEAVKIATNTGASSTTNQDGNYEIPYLPSGVYRVTAESPGFKKAVWNSIELRVNDRLSLDFKLDVGEVKEAVVVTGETPLLESTNASIGTIQDDKRTSELMNVGGNSYYLASLAAGISRSGGLNTGLQLQDNIFNNMVAVGTGKNMGEASLDGVSNMSRQSTAYVVPQDLVQELKVQTAAYDATQGHAAGVIINMATKSGTNNLHGTTYYFDQRIMALDWFSDNWLYDPTTGPINSAKRDQVAVERLHQQWGGTLSGPVVIPKLYDGRNRTFFSFGYEGLRIDQPSATISTVPTAAERQGDFSALLSLGSQYQIYDPGTIASAPAGRFSRQPLPGNVIPASRLDAIGSRIVNYWPDANRAGTVDGQQNYIFVGHNSKTVRSLTGRVDHQFSEKHRVFFRLNDFLFANSKTTMPTIASTDTAENNPSYGLMLDDVYVFSPTLLLNVRYGATFLRDGVFPKSSGFDLASLGFPASLLSEIKSKDNPAGIAFPQIATQGYANLGATGGKTYTTNYQTLAGTLTRIAGDHSFRVGGEFRLQRENGYNFGNVAPNLTFNSTWTNGPVDNSPGAPIGQGLASLLLGIPAGGGIDTNASYAEQSTFWAGYVQDDWRVSRKLTLNLGVRYEYEGSPTERYNRSVSGFDFRTPSPIQAQAQANYAKTPIPELPVSQFSTLGGLMFAGVNGQSRALFSSDKNNFAPRVGLAWQVTPKTVVRAGYGIFYDQLGINTTSVNQTGFSQRSKLIPSLDNGLSFAGTLSNPFPSGLLSPTGAAGGLATFLGNGVTYFYPEALNPYMQRWSFTLQRELPWRVLLEASYVGNRGNKLATTRELDATPRQYLSTSPVRDQNTINFLTQTFPNPFYGIPEFNGTSRGTKTMTRGALLTPYPQFTGISAEQPLGHSSYHSLQLQAEKRFQHGVTFQAAYTWSKFMEADTLLNPTDASPEKVISALDFPQRLTVNGFYEIPIGRGKMFFSHAPGWIDKIVGGWQVEGLYEAQSGKALGFGNAIFFGDLHDIPLPSGQRSIHQWFNTSAGFDRNSRNVLANNIQTLSSRFAGIRADDVNAFELSASKNWYIREKTRLQFRAEAQNALNHPMFDAPNTNPVNAAFGTIKGTSNQPRIVTFGLKLYF